VEVVKNNSVASKVHTPTHQKLCSKTTHVSGAPSGRAGECWVVHASRAKRSLGAACTKEKHSRSASLYQPKCHVQIGPIYISSPGSSPRSNPGGYTPYHFVSFPVKKGPLKKTMPKFGENPRESSLRAEQKIKRRD